MAPDTRARMVSAAVGRLQQNGLAAMSFTDILADSGAARGAIYHHFPGGKQQIANEAAAAHGDEVRVHLAHLPVGAPAQVLAAFFDAVRPVVMASAAGAGCAVAAVTVDGGPGITDQAGLRHTAHVAFASWVDELAGKFTESTAAAGAALDLATLAVVTLQGSHVLSRAAGDIAPFDRAVAALLRSIDDGEST
jgi:TetR/AcrR family transcriptional repressor of lmrAB and yxaGH operons